MYDNYGYINGVEVLKAFAQGLVRHFRDLGLLAFYGGEKFCALLPDTTEDNTLGLVNTILQHFETLRFPVMESSVQLGVNIGIAFYNSGRYPSFDKLFADADAALSTSKGIGSNKSFVARSDFRHAR